MIIKNWKMDYENYNSISCSAPCSLYSVLLENKLIDDPFYGLNELGLTKLSDKPCRFVSEFKVNSDILEKEYVNLVFYGLDTLCTIVLNGVELARVKNMHRKYTYDVKNILKDGDNTLCLDFDSPTEYFKQKNQKHFLHTCGDAIKGAAHLRKALYMSGWDWGPKLPDMGIFRPVEIESYNFDKIDDFKVTQHHFLDKVTLDIEVTTMHNSDSDIYVQIDSKKVKLVNNKTKITIENPKLWWIRGYGEQNLYSLDIELIKDGKIIDSLSKKIGLRTVTMSTEKDKDGNEFCFVINGVKIFAMGANYIPQDNILSRINPKRTQELLNSCIDANFNCIRVWGGGYYPEDEFYDFCDENGIIIWHDFMLACMNVWMQRDFEDEIIKELTYNIRRMRNHASIGLFCGNNEMEQGIDVWHWNESILTKADYLRLYEHIIPEICEDEAPQIFYWPSSPSSGGGFDDPNDSARGDVHYWSVWHGGLPFTDYRNHRFRFCSEYGFESFPSMKTIESYCPKEEYNAFSRVMENHQKCSTGNGKILTYLSQTYLYPHSFDSLVYASQLLQADAIKYGVEYFRRIRGCCMGSIYWQFNDCWPVASWSSVDYYGRYKALHYAAKKFYAPVEMGLFLENGVLTVNVSNETMDKFDGKIHIYLCRNDFSVIAKKDVNITVKALTSSDVTIFEDVPEDIYSNYYYADIYDKNGNFIMRQTELPVKPKQYSWQEPKLELVLKKVDIGIEITVKSDRFAKNVFIDFKDFDCILSDNYFDITSKEGYTVIVKTDKSEKEVLESLITKTVYDIK